MSRGFRPFLSIGLIVTQLAVSLLTALPVAEATPLAAPLTSVLPAWVTTADAPLDDTLPPWFAASAAQPGDEPQVSPTNLSLANNNASGATSHHTIHSNNVTVSGPTEINNCDVVTFTIVAANDAVTTTNVVITSTMPAGFAPTQQVFIIGTVWPTQTITTTAVFTATCNAVSGQNVVVLTQGVTETETITKYTNFVVNPGAITLRKEPAVVEASVGDVVTWTVYVENTGYGTVSNVAVTDTLGAGLRYHSGLTATSYISIPVGQTRSFTVAAEVVACSGLNNDVEATWGCAGQTCQTHNAQASVDLLVREPMLEYTPPSVNLDYCTGQATYAMTVTNIGQGTAFTPSIAVDFSPLTVTAASAAYSGGAFHLPNHIPAGDDYALTFTLSLPDPPCGMGGNHGLFLYRPTYYDECGHPFYPPVESNSWVIGGSDPHLDVYKSGPAEVYVGDEIITYTLSVAATPAGSISGTLYITDTFHPGCTGYEPLNVAGGTVISDASGNITITWATTDTAWAADISFQIDATACPTLCNCCGLLATNSLAATARDCQNCIVGDAESIDTAIQCEEILDSHDKEIAPGTDESCTTRSYTSTYVFGSSFTVTPTWGGMIYTDTLPHQDYVTGSAWINISNGAQTCTATFSLSDTAPLVIGNISPTCGVTVPGATMRVFFQAVVDDAGSPCNSTSFYDWSYLNIGVTGNGVCLECDDGIFEEGVWVGVTQPEMEITFSNPPPYVSSCGEYTFTMNLRRISTAPAYDVEAIFYTSTYRIVNVVGLTGATPALTTTDGLGYHWFYSDAFATATTGTVILHAQLACASTGDAPITGSVHYGNNCADHTCSDTGGASPTPQVLTSQSILYKFPETIYATGDVVTWTLTAINSGAGTAYGVTLTDTLGSDLRYLRSTVTSTMNSATGVTPITSSNLVTWSNLVMLPGEEYTIKYAAEIIGCDDLTNSFAGVQGCQGQTCAAAGPVTSVVELPETVLINTNNALTPLAMCFTRTITATVRNAGLLSVRDAVITETLPAGMIYVTGSTEYVTGTGATPPATGWVGGGEPSGAPDGPLVWTSVQITNLARLHPHETVWVRFDVRADCDFNGGNITIQASYQDVCGDVRSSTASNFAMPSAPPEMTAQKRGRNLDTGSAWSNMVYAEPGETVLWDIRLTNGSDTSALFTVVTDVLPANTTYVAASPTPDGVNVASGVITWNLGTLGHTTWSALITATVDNGGCTASDTTNTLTAVWGCPDGCREQATARATLRTRPSFDTISMTTNLSATVLHRCGGVLTVTLVNDGPPAYNVTLTDTLPTGFVYSETVYASTTPLTYPAAGDNPAIWAWGAITLPTGVTTIAFLANSGTGGTCNEPVGGSNVVAVLYDDADSCLSTGPYIDSASADISVANPALQIEKTPATQASGAGGVVTWTIRLTNTGTGIAPNVLVTDVVGSNFISVTASFGSDADETNTPTVVGNVITWTPAITIAAGDTWTAVVSATVQATGVNHNVVTATGYCDTGCAYSAASGLAHVTLVDAFSKGPKIQTGTIGSLAVFTFTAFLPDQDATYGDLILTDTLPVGLGYVTSTLVYTYNSPAAPTTLISTTPTITPGWLASGSVVWALGDLSGTVQINGVITAVIQNISANQDGVRRTNVLTITYTDDGQPYAYTDTADVDIIEPLLEIDKGVESSTGSLIDLDGAAYLTYTIRITNTGTSPAYKVVITDAIPAGISVTALYGGDSRSAPIQGLGLLTWTVAVMSDTLPGVNNPLLLTYTARISNAPVGDALTNIVTATYSSLPGEPPPGQERDYGPLTNTETVTPTGIAVSKLADPYTLRVGDIVTYTLVFTVPAGTVGMGGNSYLVDTLPEGVQYITASETLAWTPPSVSVVTTGRAVDSGNPQQVVTWTFGSPITSTQDTPTVITLTFQAQATGVRVNDSAPVWPNQTAIYPLTNTVALWQRDEFVDDGRVNNQVIQPSLSIDKDSIPPSGSYVGAGEAITYTLTITNDGTAPAYDIIVTDALPPGIDYLRTISAPNPASAVITTVIAGSQITYTVSLLAAGPGATMVFTVVARVTGTVGANLTLTNTAAIPYYDSQPGPGPGPLTPTQRTYTDGSDSVVHRTVDAAITKSVTPPTATLGTLVTCTLIVPAQPITATLYDATVADTLDPRLQLLSVTDGPDGAVQTTGNDFTVTYASIPAGEQRTITVTAVLSAPLAASAGDTISNVAVLTHSNGVTASNEVSTTVVEPDLTLSKDADPPGGSVVDEGDWITYTVVITNAAGPNVSPAYDLALWDTLPLWMRTTPPTVLGLTINGSTVTTDSQSYDSVSGRLIITLAPEISLPVGGRLVFSYSAQVDLGVPSGLALTNGAQGGYSSLPGDVPGDRDYLTNEDDETHYTPIATGLLKFVTPATATIGSQVVYTYQIPSPLVGATLQNIVFTDSIPSNLAVTGVSGDGGFLSGWSGGNLVTGTVASIPAFDSVVVTVTCTVRDIPTNTDGTIITNTATLDYSGNPGDPPISNVVTTTLRWPNVAVSKSVTPPVVASGGRVTFTLAYSNVGPVLAENVVITDTLPSGLSYSSAVPGPSGVSGQAITWSLGALGAGAGGVIQLVATVDATSTTYAVLTNTVVITTTTPETNTTNNDDDATVVLTQTCDLSVVKSAQPPSVVSGDRITYTLAYANAGPADADNVCITDTLPSGLTFAGCDPATCSVAGQVITWSLGTLPAGALGVLTLYATVDVTGATSAVFTNTVVITTSTGDRDPGNNDDDVATPLTQTIGLQVIKQAEPTAVANGQTLTYTVRLVNTGDVPLNPVALTDTLPAGFLYADHATPMEPDVITGSTQIWNDVTGGVGLAAGASLTVTFRATVAVGVAITGTYVNLVTGTGDYPGGVITDTDDSPVDVIPPSVAVVKSLAEHNREAGIVTFTLEVINTGPTTLDVIPLHDLYDPYYLGFLTANPMPDEPADDGRLDWYDLTAPAPNGFDANLPPGERFTITVAFGIMHDITSTVNTAVITDATDVYGNPANDDDDEVINDVPTAIELLYFRATPQPCAVLLEWATAVEIDNYGFYLLRSAGGSLDEAEEIAFVPAAGHGRGGGAVYSFKDLTAQPGVPYTYWLVDVDTGGHRTVHSPVTAAALPDMPHRIYLPLIVK